MTLNKNLITYLITLLLLVSLGCIDRGDELQEINNSTNNTSVPQVGENVTVPAGSTAVAVDRNRTDSDVLDRDRR